MKGVGCVAQSMLQTWIRWLIESGSERNLVVVVEPVAGQPRFASVRKYVELVAEHSLVDIDSERPLVDGFLHKAVCGLPLSVADNRMSLYGAAVLCLFEVESVAVHQMVKPSSQALAEQEVSVVPLGRNQKVVLCQHEPEGHLIAHYGLSQQYQISAGQALIYEYEKNHRLKRYLNQSHCDWVLQLHSRLRPMHLRRLLRQGL